jgi:hypothetical protein
VSEETDKPEGAEQDSQKPEDQLVDPRTPVTLSYGGASQLVSGDADARLALFSNTRRADVKADAKVKDPLTLREALSALYEVVSSDFRYVPRDKTAYLAYMRLRKSMAGQSAAQAQHAYFEWLARNDPTAWLVLDPIVTVHPDRLLLEVFSKDEGAYAQLGVDWSAFDVAGTPSYGTTNIDYSKGLFDGVQRMRSYRPTRLTIGRDAVTVTPATPSRRSKRRSRSPTPGCAASCRSRARRPCRPRSSRSPRSTSTTCSVSCACTPTARAAAAASASSWSPASPRASCSSRGRSC